MKITYREGSLFDFVPSQCGKSDNIFICHVCNDCGRMGAGFVLPLNKRYPIVKDHYMWWYRDKTLHRPMFELGAVQYVTVADRPNVTVCNMVAQHNVGGSRPLRYDALAKCMDHVGKVASSKQSLPDVLDSYSTQCTIHAPFFGAGLAGGDWHFIEQLIDDCWLKRNIPVTIHYIAGKTPSGWSLP